MKNLRILGFFSAFLTLAVDFISKYAALEWFNNGNHALALTPFFNIILAFNRGVSFGMFHADGPSGVYMLLAVAVILSALVGNWLWHSENKTQSISFGLILGGALGNIYDRATYGAVVDFLDFHALGYHWYTFNIADCGITIGTVLLLINLIFYTSKKDSHE